MSVEQIEEQVRRLPPEDLAQFVFWLDAHLGRALHGGDQPEAEGEDLSAEEKQELVRRRTEILADPSLALPMDDEYFERLKHQLRDAAPQKASCG